MRKPIKPNLTIAKRLVRRSLKRAGQSNLVNLQVAWGNKPFLGEGHDGQLFWTASIVITADGFKPKRMLFQSDDCEIFIR